MDLAEFIKETIRGIASSTKELQIELESDGIILNPPLNPAVKDLYLHQSSDGLYRRVEIIEFDVAVTAASESGASGKAGIRVFAFEASLGGEHAGSREEISRVKFSLPIVLSPAQVELQNRDKVEEAREVLRKELAEVRAGPKKGRINL